MERDFSGITKLIQAAGKAGVKKLTIGDIVVDFSSDTMTQTEVFGDGDDRVVMNHAVEVTPQQEADVLGLQQEELLITDPLEYERLQME